jgi:hypothetical protein
MRAPRLAQVPITKEVEGEAWSDEALFSSAETPRGDADTRQIQTSLGSGVRLFEYHQPRGHAAH